MDGGGGREQDEEAGWDSTLEAQLGHQGQRREEFRPKKAGSKRRKKVKKGKMLYLSHKKRKNQKGEEEKKGKNKG